MSVGKMPSDLENLSCGSMNKLPSLERERLLREQLQMKEEGMDFEDDSNGSSGTNTHMRKAFNLFSSGVWWKMT